MHSSQYLHMKRALEKYLPADRHLEVLELGSANSPGQTRTHRSLFDGIDQCVAGNRLGDVSHAIQTRVEADGFSVIRSLVGHGIGREMHEDPQIPNFGDPGTGPELEEGMVLAIEPMVNVGTHHVRMGSDNWAVYSEDGSLAAHFEHTVAITGEGPRILTPWHLSEAEPLQAATLSGRR